MKLCFNSFIKNKEVANTGWIVGVRMIQMILSLIVGVLTSRYLGPSNYGTINYATAYVVFFTSLCNLGINAVIVQDFISNKNKQGEAIGTAIILQIISSFLSVAIIIGIVAVVDRNEPLTIAVVALCSASLIFRSFETFKYWFQAQYRSKISSLAVLFAYLVVSVYKIILLVLQKDVRWFAFATSVDYFFIAVFLIIVYRKSSGPPLAFSLNKAKSLLSKSYHYILSGTVVAIYAQTDKLMLKHMLDQKEVGYYSVATSICAMWVFVLQAIIDSAYPTIMRLHKEDREAYERKNRQIYAIIFYVSIVVSVGFLIIGKYVVHFLYGDEYLQATIPLKIVTWYTAFSYLGVARDAWIVCENKQKYLKYMYSCAALINIVLNYMLIPLWGASGAAAASLIVQICTCILLPLAFRDLRPNAKLMLQAIFLRNL